MFPRVISVRQVVNYELEVGFSDGTLAVLDFRPRIEGRGGAFTLLQDVEFFGRVAVDPEAGTLVWPNGVDFCPDVLYADATGKLISELGTELELV